MCIGTIRYKCGRLTEFPVTSYGDCNMRDLVLGLMCKGGACDSKVFMGDRQEKCGACDECRAKGHDGPEKNAPPPPSIPENFDIEAFMLERGLSRIGGETGDPLILLGPGSATGSATSSEEGTEQDDEGEEECEHGKDCTGKWSDCPSKAYACLAKLFREGLGFSRSQIRNLLDVEAVHTDHKAVWRLTILIDVRTTGRPRQLAAEVHSLTCDPAEPKTTNESAKTKDEDALPKGPDMNSFHTIEDVDKGLAECGRRFLEEGKALEKKRKKLQGKGQS